MSDNGKINIEMNAKVLWAEKLGILDVINSIISRPFSSRAIYYGEHGESLLAGRLLALTKRCKIRHNIFPVSLSLEKESPDAQTLAYNVDEDLLMCGERFIKDHAGDRPLALKNAIKCYISGWLRSRVAFAAVVESKSKSMPDKGHSIRFERHPMNKLLYHLYEERGFTIKESFGISEHLRRMGRILKLAIGVVKARLVRSHCKSSIGTPTRPAIWIEYTHKDIVDFAFWKTNVRHAHFDIVYYLDRADTPVVAEITDEIEKSGARWVDAHLEAMSANVSISKLMTMIKGLFKSDGRPFWLKTFDFEYAFWLSAYEACFKKFKVKILIQHQDTSWRQDAQARAIESAGGIMIGFHWSNYPARMIPAHIFPFHLFFVWGKIFYDRLQSDGNSCNYVLPSGNWIRAGEADLGEMKKRLKTMKFKFTIFGSSVAHHIHQTPRSLSCFYSRLLGLLEKNPSWGAVMKNKSGDIESLLFLPDGADLLRRFRSLMENDKVFILDRQLSPPTAAALTDISVSYGLNSAGIIAGICGNRALHWDCSGWGRHPIYGDPEQKILYKDLEKLEEAIYKANAGDISIGDFSKWKKAFNYYEDDNASRRVGGFIQSFMDDVIEGADAIRSLDKAVRKYVDDNNVGDDFIQDGVCWKDDQAKGDAYEVYDRV